MAKNLTKIQHLYKNLKTFKSPTFKFYKFMNKFYKGFECDFHGKILLKETDYNNQIKFIEINSHEFVSWTSLKDFNNYVEQIKEDFNFDRNIFFKSGNIYDEISNKIFFPERIINAEKNIIVQTDILEHFALTNNMIRKQDLIFFSEDFTLIKTKDCIFIKNIS